MGNHTFLHLPDKESQWHWRRPQIDCGLNSLSPDDAIWRHRTNWTLTLCLIVPLPLLFFREVVWNQLDKESAYSVKWVWKLYIYNPCRIYQSPMCSNSPTRWHPTPHHPVPPVTTDSACYHNETWKAASAITVATWYVESCHIANQ